LLRAGL